MKYPILRHAAPLMTVLLGSIALGCTTVVNPVSSLETTVMDKNYGLLVGAIHLTRDERSLSAGLKWPAYTKWWIVEETHGTRMLLTPLPLDGDFTLKLPPGSYRITDVSFHSSQGAWHTELPTTFRILSGECTSLGALKLDLLKGFRVGWITQQVSGENVRAEDHKGKASEASDCSTIAPLTSDYQRLIRLSLYRPDQLIRP
ncbi:MAG: hypothetical protein ACT4PN_16715 [Nitrospiraceae bacterium]